MSDADEMVARYYTRFCSHTEINHFYSPEFDPVVFDVDAYRFGCVICVEINFPQLFASTSVSASSARFCRRTRRIRSSS